MPPIPPRTPLAPHRYGIGGYDPLAELPEPAQTEIRKRIAAEMPATEDPLVYASGFDGMAYLAMLLNYRAAASRLHDVANFIRARHTNAMHG